MEDYNISLGSVIKANSIKFRLSKNLYKINREILGKEMDDILKYSKCVSVRDYFDKLKKISENKNYVRKSIELGVRLKVDVEESEKIVKIFQKVISLNMLNRDIFDKDYYLPCFIDNRGRQYYGTLLSPTFYKIFRNMYSFVDEKDFSNLENSKFYKNIMEYKNLVKNFNLNDKESYIALILFIEIGKNFIKVSNDCFVETKDMIEMGISNFYSTGELDLSDTMYVNKIKNELKKLLKKEKVDVNTIIFKDATASGLQNYGILLGYKKEMLKYLNIDGDK